MSVLLNNSGNRSRKMPGVGRRASPSRERAINSPRMQTRTEADAMVFVVDDDAPMRESLKNLIRSAGLRVEVFDSAEEFLLGQRANLPRCLVLDVRLPGLSGLDLQKRMAEIAMEIPTIFISGHADISMSVHAMKAGATEFLIKPFRDQDLIDAIERAIQRDRAGRRRAAKLTEASEALRRCLDALPLVPKVDDFLGQVLATVTRQLNASSSTLFLRNGKLNALTLDLLVEEGSVMTPVEASYPEKLRLLRLDKCALEMFRQPAVIIDLVNGMALISNVHRSYLRELGLKTLLIVPLIIARELIGCLNFRFMEYREFRREDIEIARALATQTSLAIQLTRLAKTARQTGILEERNRLAGEIHDSLVQSFAAIATELGIAGEAIQPKRGDGVVHLDRAKDLARLGIAEARCAALSLHPFNLDKIGLTETIRLLVERSNVPGRIQCTLSAGKPLPRGIPLETQQQLLRIAQEAISNSARHADATRIWVSLQCDRGCIELQIRDNGRGTAAELVRQKGFGLINMQNRARKIGARLKIQTTVGGGASIIVKLPIEQRFS
jgi:signal transduction histidine kinase/CheY-like chemotaxis protein